MQAVVGSMDAFLLHYRWLQNSTDAAKERQMLVAFCIYLTIFYHCQDIAVSKTLGKIVSRRGDKRKLLTGEQYIGAGSYVSPQIYEERRLTVQFS